MEQFIITEEERKRILNLHEERTSNHYLMEQRSLNFPASVGGKELKSKGVQKGTWKKLNDTTINIYYRDKSGKNVFFKSLEIEPEYLTGFSKLVKINQVGNWELTGGNEISIDY